MRMPDGEEGNSESRYERFGLSLGIREFCPVTANSSCDDKVVSVEPCCQYIKCLLAAK